MNELDVFRLLLARRDNYGISEIAHISGRAYSLVMHGKKYNAVVLPNSFAFYEKRYHIAKQVPDLVICFAHDTVLAIPCLSMKTGTFAESYDLPVHIKDVEKQRHRSKVGSQVLLGMYLCGMVEAQVLVNKFKPTTRKRYVERATELGRRRPGRPVGIEQTHHKLG
jgi:hypothetical protein